MGWPSMTKLTWAWSPSGWKNPFASAAVPPVLLLMMLLNPDAGSKRGNLRNEDASASVCADGSVSISGAVDTTSTLVATVDIFMVNVIAIGTEPRTSTCSVLGAKPGAVSTSSYMFGGTLLNRNAPV